MTSAQSTREPDWSLPDAGAFDDEYLFNDETETYVRGRLVVTCPCCGLQHRPLLSRYTERVRGEWRWVGLDHKQPEVDYRARCPRTKTEYRFTTYTPQ